jgi:hypothetical protein
LLAAAYAQTPPPSTTVTRFDGTYAFVSSKKVNETYTALAGQMGQCSDRIAGPLIIVNGEARYSGFGRRSPAEFEGMVGSQGELSMRSVMRGVQYEISVRGSIDSTHTVNARQSGYICSYDFVWRKVPKWNGRVLTKQHLASVTLYGWRATKAW